MDAGTRPTPAAAEPAGFAALPLRTSSTAAPPPAAIPMTLDTDATIDNLTLIPAAGRAQLGVGSLPSACSARRPPPALAAGSAMLARPMLPHPTAPRGKGPSNGGAPLMVEWGTVAGRAAASLEGEGRGHGGGLAPTAMDLVGAGAAQRTNGTACALGEEDRVWRGGLLVASLLAPPTHLPFASSATLLPLRRRRPSRQERLHGVVRRKL